MENGRPCFIGLTFIYPGLSLSEDLRTDFTRLTLPRKHYYIIAGSISNYSKL